jgi:hypothetical protein
MRETSRVLRATAAFVLLTSLASGQDVRRALVPARGTATVIKAVATMPGSDAPCPKTVLVTFVVKVTRPGILYFRRVGSDGSRDTTVQTASFDRIGDFDLAAKLPNPISWTFAKPFRGWVGIHFDANPAGDTNVEPAGKTAWVDLACPVLAAGMLRQSGLAPASAAPASVAPASSTALRGKLSARLQFPGLRAISPLVIQAGASAHAPHLTTASPYFSLQIQPKSPARGPASVDLHEVAGKPSPLSFSYVEVEQTNIAQHRADCFGPNAPTNVEFGCHLKWGDDAKVKIGRPGDPGFYERFNRVSFRWISSEARVVGAHWQVSRHPFTTDAQHWQDSEVAGLVDSGPVTNAFVDAEGLQHFQIDFSRSANGGGPGGLFHMLAAGPAKAALTMGGGTAATSSPQGKGPANLVPVSVARVPAGTGMHQIGAQRLSAVRSALLDMDRTFYVRVVPLHEGGKAGLPTIPVEVTVTRPQLCQPPAPNQNTYVVVRPPSAKVVSFSMTSFVPTFIQTDQNGKLVGRAHYLSIAPPPGCDPNSSPNAMLGDLTYAMFKNLAHGQVGYHFFVDPPDTHWYDTAWDIVKALVSVFETLVNSVSSAWSQIESFVVQVVADALHVVTFNTFTCGDDCKTVLGVALKTMMAASGIPPTLPNCSELENLSVDYLAKMGAEELGAEGVLDTAEDIYGNLPPGAKQEIQKRKSEVSSALATAFATNTAAAAAAGAGSWFVPDPLYYQSHPAYLMVKVYNTNADATDPVYLHYGDSAGLYKQRDPVYIPSLKPGASTVVPIVLYERFDSVYSEQEHCTHDAYTSVCGDICIPCYWNLWVFAAERASDPPNSGDTFWVGLSTRINGIQQGLGPLPSGKPLGSEEQGPPYDDYGQKCAISHANLYLKYPDGWKVMIESLKQDLRSLMWLNYTFSEGDHGLLRTN